MIEGLNVAAIAFALAACALMITIVELVDRAHEAALHWIEDRRTVRDRQPQPDEAQLLLALLCEQLHERLERDGTPPRTVINLTAGQWHEVASHDHSRVDRRERRDCLLAEPQAMIDCYSAAPPETAPVAENAGPAN
jgi:hypothetical protein